MRAPDRIYMRIPGLSGQKPLDASKPAETN
jgi:hypothetical protein